MFSTTTGGDIKATVVTQALLYPFPHKRVITGLSNLQHCMLPICHSIVVRLSQLTAPLCQSRFLHLAQISSPVSSHPNLAQAHIQSNVSFSFFSGLPSGKSCFSKWIRHQKVSLYAHGHTFSVLCQSNKVVTVFVPFQTFK